MRKVVVIPTLLFALALICAFGAYPALAYYAPMQNVTGPTVVGNTVTVSVHNPATGQDIAHTWSPPAGSGTIVIDQIHNVQGIVAWRVQDTTNNQSKIVWGVYDPGWKGNPDGWMFKEPQWDPNINIIAINDGVVVSEAKYSETDFYIRIWTYEPAQYFDPYYGWMPSGWTSVSSWVGRSPHDYNVKDGVVAWVIDHPPSTSSVDLSIYDTHRYIRWQCISTQTPLNPSPPQISNATVTWSDTSGDQKWGYDPATTWVKGADTKVMAYFEYWPTPGTAQQPVWFTDMSIGATSWNWTLGDGSVSSLRSLYHKYASAGNYVGNLQISGPNGTDAHNQTVPVNPGKGMTPAGPLMLLLLMDN